ncbi:MAG: hypothetical protein ACRET7_10845 [Burkholderiales bacterium]
MSRLVLTRIERRVVGRVAHVTVNNPVFGSLGEMVQGIRGRLTPSARRSP